MIALTVEKELLEDWDLDLEEHRRKADFEARSDRRPPRLVHKLMFSMPEGTPRDKVVAAVKNFAREENLRSSTATQCCRIPVSRTRTYTWW
jgi:hypothetical protein